MTRRATPPPPVLRFRRRRPVGARADARAAAQRADRLCRRQRRLSLRQAQRGGDREPRARAARPAGRALSPAPRRDRLQHRLDHRARPCPRGARPAGRRHGPGDQARRRNVEEPGDRRARHRGDGAPALCRRPRRALRRRLHDHPPRLAGAGRAGRGQARRRAESRVEAVAAALRSRCSTRRAASGSTSSCSPAPTSRCSTTSSRRLPRRRPRRRRPRHRAPHRLSDRAARPGPTQPPPGIASSPARHPASLEPALARFGLDEIQIACEVLRVVRNGIAAEREAKGRQARISLDYDRIFRSAIDRLHDEGRYRVFIDILRTKGSFPNARCFAGNGPKPITVWCSNDYLGMGQHPAVVDGDGGSAARGRRRLGRHPQHQRQHPLSHRARSRACRAFTARKARCCSPRAMSRTRRRCRRSASCCPAASSSPTSSTTPR